MEFQSNPEVVVLRIVCRYNVQLSGRDMFAAVTRQLLELATKQDVLTYLRLFYDKHRMEKTTPNSSDFIRLFQVVFAMYQTVMISIDALDESTDEVKEQLLEGLAQVDAILFITSRPSAELFKNMLENVHSMKLESSSMIAADIRHFIRVKMTSIPRLRYIVANDRNILDTICQRLSAKSSGMSVALRYSSTLVSS